MKEFYIWNILVYCICKILSILYLLTVISVLASFWLWLGYILKSNSGVYTNIYGELSDANTDAEVS